jgi:hypothetical protein
MGLQDVRYSKLETRCLMHSRLAAVGTTGGAQREKRAEI